jgi:hypothetical protein
MSRKTSQPCSFFDQPLEQKRDTKQDIHTNHAKTTRERNTFLKMYV